MAGPIATVAMGWIEPVSTAITAAELAKEVVESSSKVLRFAKRLRYRVRYGKAAIPIFGAGGVGKTTVSKLLVGGNPLDIASQYEESDSVEIENLKGDVPGQLLVAPGQPGRRQQWPNLFKKLASGESFGVVNVVSYGLHAFELASHKEHPAFQPSMTVEGFTAAYAESKRQEELDALHHLIRGMSAVTKPIWMATLVTKQDLWWPQRDTVRSHYEAGAYAQAIRQVASAIGERNFQHEFIPVSLTISSLCSQDGTVLVPTAAGYGLPIHLRYLRSMFERFHRFLGGGRR